MVVDVRLLSDVVGDFLLQTVLDQLEASEPDVQHMQKAAQGVLVKLPPSEAKVGIQKQVLGIQDKFEE